MNLNPAFGLIGTLNAAVTSVMAALAINALVLVMIFLRPRIAELKRAQRAGTAL